MIDPTFGAPIPDSLTELSIEVFYGLLLPIIVISLIIVVYGRINEITSKL